MTLWLIIHMLDLIWLDVEMVVQVLREVYLAWRHCIFEKPKKWYQSLKSNQLSIKSSVKKKVQNHLSESALLKRSSETQVNT